MKLGVFICEDGWTENYDFNVPQILTKNGAQLLINISCSPFTLQKNRKRGELFKNKQGTAVCRFFTATA
ncbi:hypothetical protein M5E89_05185 [Acidaminococcus intestini]|nr:hypothetical protein M5E89_05185 [Acidaminococcus intestini]